MRDLVFSLMGWFPGQVSGELDLFYKAVERGGLVGVILVLCIVVWHLYTAKEKLQNDHATKLLSLVEKQTEVITKQTLITERVESLLAKTTRLGGKE